MARETQALQEKTALADQARREREARVTAEDRVQQLGEELRRATEKHAETAGRSVVSIVLSAALRSGATPDQLTLDHDTKTAVLNVPVSNQDQIQSYSALLQTTAGRTIVSRQQLRPKANSRVVLSLPAASLSNDTYKLTLCGRTND